MLATLVDEPFDDKRWVFETKWDGFRLITEKRGHSVRLWSRNGVDVTTKYEVLLPALQKAEGSCVIDGELCALDAHGRSHFHLLQNALNKKATLLYVVFDALFAGDKDIRKTPLLEHTLSVRLLDRGPPCVQLTIYGRALLKRSNAVFDELKQSVRDIEFLADPTVGKVRFGCHDSIAAQHHY